MEGKLELDFAVNSGELLLRSGAETYRVGDTIKRICQRNGFKAIEVFVFPTGIIVNCKYNGYRLTSIKQVMERNINLSLISRINDLSRRYAAGELSLCQSLKEITRLKSASEYNEKTVLLAGALASAATTILFGGSWVDFFPAFTATIIVRLMLLLNISSFLRTYMAGFAAGLLGAIFVGLGFGVHADKIIVGAVTPLVPGIALTSAIRDFISGDLLSGTVRLTEALLISATIASGVATGLGTSGVL